MFTPEKVLDTYTYTQTRSCPDKPVFSQTFLWGRHFNPLYSSDPGPSNHDNPKSITSWGLMGKACDLVKPQRVYTQCSVVSVCMCVCVFCLTQAAELTDDGWECVVHHTLQLTANALREFPPAEVTGLDVPLHQRHGEASHRHKLQRDTGNTQRFEGMSSLPQHQQWGLTSSLSVSLSIKPCSINQTQILNTTKITYDRVLPISWASCCSILLDKAQHSEKCPTGILKCVQNTLWYSFRTWDVLSVPKTFKLSCQNLFFDTYPLFLLQIWRVLIWNFTFSWCLFVTVCKACRPINRSAN